MKFLTATALIALLSTSSFAAPIENCWPASGNWENASTKSCKTPDGSNEKDFCDRYKNRDKPECSKCGGGHKA